MEKPYRYIALGGTFDHFHKGHERFIEFASELGEVLLIGVTSNEIASKKSWSEQIESYQVRTEAVRTFCQKKSINCEIIELHDSVGSTLTDDRIQALAVTTETKSGGEYINRLRVENGLPPLTLHVCNLFLAKDGQPLHSDRIRAGECDRKGLMYFDLFNKPIVISPKQRLALQQPQGQLVDRPTTIFNGQPIILVGDSTIERFVANNWPFHLGIFDRKVQRQPATGITQSLTPNVTVANPAGTIQSKLAHAINFAIRSPQPGSTHPARHAGLDPASSNSIFSPGLENQPYYIFVDGEEDLAAVPAVLLAPLGSTINYGQPKEGLIQLPVTEPNKSQILQILSYQ